MNRPSRDYTHALPPFIHSGNAVGVQHRKECRWKGQESREILAYQYARAAAAATLVEGTRASPTSGPVPTCLLIRVDLCASVASICSLGFSRSHEERDLATDEHGSTLINQALNRRRRKSAYRSPPL